MHNFCAQKHVDLVNGKIETVQHALNEKLSSIDRLSTLAKEHINAERVRIIEQADIERDKALIQIDEIAEQQRKQILSISTQLNELALDEISSFIQQMTNEIFLGPFWRPQLGVWVQQLRPW